MSQIEHNKLGLKAGDRVLTDADKPNRCEVVIISITPLGMFSTVKADNGHQWQIMTTRLSKI